MRAIASNDELTWTPPAPSGGRGVPLVRALIAQIVAGVAAALYTQLDIPAPVHPLLVQSVVAVTAGQAPRLPLWWVPINAAFFSSGVAGVVLLISPGGFFAGFGACMGFFLEN